MPETPDISIIIPCKNEGEHVRNTLDSILSARTDATYEIIVVDDGSTDDCCRFLADSPPDRRITFRALAGVGSANARNEAAKDAVGKVLLFCDAHIFVEDEWLDRLMDALNRPEVDAVSPGIASNVHPEVVGYGMSWDSNLSVYWPAPPERELAEVPILPGGCLAIPAQTFREVGGFETGFRVWGREDEEFSLRCWLFGLRLFVTTAARILHVFRQVHPYQISMAHIHHNTLRMALSHFDEQRIAKVTDMIRNQRTPELDHLMGELFLSDIWTQRRQYRARRVHDDEWFMQKFKIPF